MWRAARDLARSPGPTLAVLTLALTGSGGAAAAVAGVVWVAAQLGEREDTPSGWVWCPRELTYTWAWREAGGLRHYRWLPDEPWIEHCDNIRPPPTTFPL